MNDFVTKFVKLYSKMNKSVQNGSKLFKLFKIVRICWNFVVNLY